MKQLLYFFGALCLSLNSTCAPSNPSDGNCKKAYNRIIFNDLSVGKYLTSVRAEYGGETFTIVLNSYDLSKYLEADRQKLDSVSVERVLDGSQTIHLKKENISEVKIIKSWKSIDNIVKQGKEATLKHFFFNEMQRSYLSQHERLYLISILHSWCLLTFIDDETGYLQYRTVQ